MSYVNGDISPMLVGATPVMLQAWLTAAQTAYFELMSGAKVVSASYGTGDGSRSVSYSQASLDSLRALILQLQRALGMNVRPQRRRIGFRF